VHGRFRDNTVKTHITHILMKLKLRGRVQAVVLAYETGSSTSAESGQAALFSAPGFACDDPLQLRISALRITWWVFASSADNAEIELLKRSFSRIVNSTGTMCW
jgi:hypothetical protein